MRYLIIVTAIVLIASCQSKRATPLRFHQLTFDSTGTPYLDDSINVSVKSTTSILLPVEMGTNNTGLTVKFYLSDTVEYINQPHDIEWGPPNYEWYESLKARTGWDPFSIDTINPVNVPSEIITKKRYKKLVHDLMKAGKTVVLK